jgi:hypothetical protein
MPEITQADRLQVQPLEVVQIGQACGQFQFPIREPSLKFGQLGLLAPEFFLLGSQQRFRQEGQGESLGHRRGSATLAPRRKCSIFQPAGCVALAY